MSKSLALLHYPYLVYRGNQKKLWDPVRKQALKIRPEERVRQRLLNCFFMESLHPKSRISMESPVRSNHDSTAKRTDLICYDSTFNPRLLVECKAEKVAIGEEAAIQIARYNQKVGAAMLLLTNGVTDQWYEVRQHTAQSLDHPPSPYDVESVTPKNTDYWIDRGFIGSESPDILAESVTSLLNSQWINPGDTDPSVTFLSFNQHPERLILDHYYRVTTVHESPPTRVALAFIASKSRQTHLACIINREKENIGFININLNFLHREKRENMFVYSPGQAKSFDAGDILSADTERWEPEWFESLPKKIANWFFDTHLQS